MSLLKFYISILESDYIIWNGTFQTAPELFYGKKLPNGTRDKSGQLFTIMFRKGFYNLPGLYVLMEKRNTEHYEAVLGMI